MIEPKQTCIICDSLDNLVSVETAIPNHDENQTCTVTTIYICAACGTKGQNQDDSFDPKPF